MRTLLICCFLLLLAAKAEAQADTTGQPVFGIGLGSLRNRYPYPVTDLQFLSGKMAQHYRVSARLRSYGIRSIANGRNYDLTLTADYVTHPLPSVNIHIGAGTDIRLRFNNDVRSEAQTSAEPLLKISGIWSYKRSAVALPCWTRLYSNGAGITLMPEYACSLNRRWALFARVEISWLKIYGSAHEWRYDSMIGCNYRFAHD